LGLALPAFEVLFAFGVVTEAPWPFNPSARPRRVLVEILSGRGGGFTEVTLVGSGGFLTGSGGGFTELVFAPQTFPRSFHAMPALSQSDLVRGWFDAAVDNVCEPASIFGAAPGSVPSDFSTQTFALSFQTMFALSQSIRVSG
jgi:hypothetical protein